MSVYDTLPNGSQVKCWGCDMEILHVGDSVYNYDVESYIVLLREGGHVTVENGTITEIVEDGKPYSPEDFTVPCMDKWGGWVMNRSDLKGTTEIVSEEPYYPEDEPNRYFNYTK